MRRDVKPTGTFGRGRASPFLITSSDFRLGARHFGRGASGSVAISQRVQHLQPTSRRSSLVPTLRTCTAAALIALSLLARRTVSQAPTPPAYSCRFMKIPVRDGVHLNTSICEPSGPHGSLP